MTKEEMILAGLERIEVKQDRQSVRIEEVVSLLAAHAVRIAALEEADREHDRAHGRHRAEHKAFMVKTLLALLGSIPAVVGAAWWLARKLP